MKKHPGCSGSIQKQDLLTNRIFDAVNEWLTYYDTDIEFLGISIDPKSLNVEVCAEEESDASCEWVPLESIVIDGEPDADTVLDLANQFSFAG